MRLARERKAEGAVGDVEELIDAGDHVVLRMKGPDPQAYGEAPGEEAMTIVFTIRHGRIVRMQDYASRVAALTAVGLTSD
jgi:ketosteroid isomerase-like protein